MKEKKRGTKIKALLILLASILGIFLFLFIQAQLPAPNYTIQGNSVYIDDQNVYINVTPHTSNNPIIEFRSKNFSGNVDIVLGFNTTLVTPIKAETNPRLVNVTKSYTCNQAGTFFNYTLSPQHFWCFKNDTALNGTTIHRLIFDHDFVTGDLVSKTASWIEQEEQWTDVSGVFNQVNYNFQQFDKWFFKGNIPITANQTYKLRLSLQSNTATPQKYFFGVKPSSQTLEQAIASGTFYYIDPWTEYIRSHDQAQTNTAEDTAERGLAIIPTVNVNLSKVTFYAGHRGGGVSLFFANGTHIANYTNSTEGNTNTTINYPMKAGVEYYICSYNQGVSAWKDPAAYPYNRTYVNFTTSLDCANGFLRQNNVVREVLSITIAEEDPNTAPTEAILKYPDNNQNLTSSNIIFSVIPRDAQDSTGLNVSIWGNWTGAWHRNVSNASALNNTQTNFSISGISDGKYIWGAEVKDSGGLVLINTTNYTFTKDTVAPVISLPFYVNGTVKTSTSSTLTLNISITDAMTNPSACKVDINGTNQTYSVSNGWCNITDGYLTNLADGNRTINVYANDSTGQFGLNNSFVVFIDATAPTIKLPFYTNATQKKTTDLLTLNISVSDATSGLTGSACRVNINGTNQSVALSNGWCNTTGIVLTGNSDGNITINVYANDTQNTWGVNNSFVVTIDNTAPVITLPFYTNLTAKKNTVTLTLNVSVTDATTSPSACRIEVNGTNKTYAVSSGWCNVTDVPLTSLADGNRVINVYANDSLNTFGVNNSFYVLVDTTPPSVSFSIENNTIYYVEQFENSLTVTQFYNITEANPSIANTTVNYPNGTVLISNASTKFNHLQTYTLKEYQQYLWRVESNDTAGNVNRADLYFRFENKGTSQPSGGGGGGELPTASLLEFNMTQEQESPEKLQTEPNALLNWFNSNLVIVLLVLAFMIIGLAKGRGGKRK